MPAPVLVFGYGNPSRGDDALGTTFVDRIEALRAAHPEWPAMDLMSDFQIQVEHALDLRGRECVVLVDASVVAKAPFSYERIFAVVENAYTTHVMRPQTLLHVYEVVTGSPPPPSFLLGIRGEQFELGQPLSAAASANLERAVAFAVDLLANCNFGNTRTSKTTNGHE